MSELKSTFSPTFNEAGFEARIDWDVSRREFAQNVKKLFDDLKKNYAAFPLPCRRDDGVYCLPSRRNRLQGMFRPLLHPGFQGGLPLPIRGCQARHQWDCRQPRQDSSGAAVHIPQEGTGVRYMQTGPMPAELYPVQAGGERKGASGQQLIVGLDSFCPESWRLGQRLYMASYDLASGVKSLQELSQP